MKEGRKVSIKKGERKRHSTVKLWQKSKRFVLKLLSSIRTKELVKKRTCVNLNKILKCTH